MILVLSTAQSVRRWTRSITSVWRSRWTTHESLLSTLARHKCRKLLPFFPEAAQKPQAGRRAKVERSVGGLPGLPQPLSGDELRESRWDGFGKFGARAPIHPH